MDDRRFDELTRSVATAPSRRTLLGLLAHALGWSAAALGFSGSQGAGAAARGRSKTKPKGKPKRKEKKPPCKPACKGKECGADGCKGTCGQCPPDRVCEDGTCEPIPGAPCLDCATACTVCDVKTGKCTQGCAGADCNEVARLCAAANEHVAYQRLQYHLYYGEGFYYDGAETAAVQRDGGRIVRAVKVIRYVRAGDPDETAILAFGREKATGERAAFVVIRREGKPAYGIVVDDDGYPRRVSLASSPEASSRRRAVTAEDMDNSGACKSCQSQCGTGAGTVICHTGDALIGLGCAFTNVGALGCFASALSGGFICNHFVNDKCDRHCQDACNDPCDDQCNSLCQYCETQGGAPHCAKAKCNGQCNFCKVKGGVASCERCNACQTCTTNEFGDDTCIENQPFDPCYPTCDPETGIWQPLCNRCQMCTAGDDPDTRVCISKCDPCQSCDPESYWADCVDTCNYFCERCVSDEEGDHCEQLHNSLFCSDAVIYCCCNGLPESTGVFCIGGSNYDCQRHCEG